MSGSLPIRTSTPMPALNIGSPSGSTKPPIIGICGIPGSGKSFLLRALKSRPSSHNFLYYEGSAMIGDLVDGGLGAFKELEPPYKLHWREQAILAIARHAAIANKTAIVSSHYAFWDNEANATPELAWTQKDEEIYTHLIYLAISPELVAARREDDRMGGRRVRPALSVDHLRRWQKWELDHIAETLHRHPHIHFMKVNVSNETSSGSGQTISRLAALFDDISIHNERDNLDWALTRFRQILRDDDVPSSEARLKTVLLLDADKTLGPADTGVMFWEKFHQIGGYERHLANFPLETIFTSMGYTYEAFRQAAMLYEEVAINFGELGDDIVSRVGLYAEMRTLLHAVATKDRVKAIVVTSGLGHVWEQVLEREGLSGRIQVISGSISGGFVVTPDVKAALAFHIHQSFPYIRTWAFGDSPIDLPMMRVADHAIVVVGSEGSRSRSMEAELEEAITHGGLEARQAVLAFCPRPDAPPVLPHPRLDAATLPIVRLDRPRFLNELLAQENQVLCADTDNPTAAQLLATPMRDAGVSGHALREAHRKAGWFLAVSYVSRVLKLEPFDMPHVQRGGLATQGWQLCNESEVTIVPLMRAGEAMAMGVSEAFPRASLVHAREPEDLKVEHVNGRKVVILVDAVVNTGNTMIKFIKRVREIEPEICLVVVAGVVQKEVLEEGGCLAEEIDEGVKVVTLRVSGNNFTGTGSTDTGNRLFNTTYLS